MQDTIERGKWADFIKEFNRRNDLRATRVEIIGTDLGAQEEESLLPLTGLSLEEKGKDAPRIEISLGGESTKDERHLTHMVSRVRSIMSKMGPDLREDALMIEDEDGTKTILHFESLPELEPAGA